MIQDAMELLRADLVNANNESQFSRVAAMGGEQGGENGQDGSSFQYDRLEYDSPEELMRHLYYTCMLSNASDPVPGSEASKAYCPRRFDGWSCWEPAPAGTVAENFCPKFILGFDPQRLAYRTCNEDGSWFMHPQSGREWSNYTNCIDAEDMQLRRLVNDIYIGGYTVSFLTLIISLCIFHSFRTLKCTRIRIHINLFTSLALSCLFWIVWYKFVVEDPDVLKANSGWCVGLHILLHYLMLVNYLWMFCEGLHLHLVLVIVFIKDIVAMRWFFTIGWILPVLLVSLYAVVRNTQPLDTDHCWMDESHAMWLLTVPVCFSLIASLVFLVNVVRVLLTKLNSTSPNPAPLGLRKATRATLILNSGVAAQDITPKPAKTLPTKPTPTPTKPTPGPTKPVETLPTKRTPPPTKSTRPPTKPTPTPTKPTLPPTKPTLKP
ncbi:calcitonin gene-related peptide type 1 receptor isoform X2 [Anopheles aquasalis]|uniref:calcitonin gene-related peptide type 1 receptor isoform X2 n=1 Tax=Anopheles aquasalis TaxID=42839 RepID=UPI00215A660D|nr:calcitonin gene-related peptide type 1 receptor isoform X2 [Anopheles aquasalis]